MSGKSKEKFLEEIPAEISREVPERTGRGILKESTEQTQGPGGITGEVSEKSQKDFPGKIQQECQDKCLKQSLKSFLEVR